MTESDWPFDSPQNEAVFTLRQIVFGGETILLVLRDEDDGAWQFLTGEAVRQCDVAIVGLSEIIKRDPTTRELSDLRPGWQAVRDAHGGSWVRSRMRHSESSME